MKNRFVDSPFSPARCPFFYGWAIVAVATLGLLASVPGQTLGVSPFVEDLIKVLGVTRDQISGAYMAGTIASALLLTWAGVLYDRWGARVVIPAAAFGLGVVLLGLSRVDAIARGGASAVGWLSPTHVAVGVLAVGFFLLRFFGQGVLTMVSRNMVMKWFDRRRGLAIGISGVFFSLGFSASPQLVDLLIERLSWDGTWALMGYVIGGGFFIVALVFCRDNPEACGLEPDGGGLAVPGRRDQAVHKEFTLQEARRTYTFWVFALSLGMLGLYVTAMTFHVVSLFEAGGMGRKQAFAIFIPASILSVSIRLVGGWLSDRVPLKLVLAALLAGLALSMTGLLLLGPGWPVAMMIVGNGVAGGLFGLVSAIAWPRYFGRRHLGAVSGLSMSVTVFCSAIGPWMFSQSLSLTGSYRTAEAACLAAVLLLLVGAMKAENPQRRLAA